MLTNFFWEIADNVDKKNPSLYSVFIRGGYKVVAYFIGQGMPVEVK